MSKIKDKKIKFNYMKFIKRAIFTLFIIYATVNVLQNQYAINAKEQISENLKKNIEEAKQSRDVVAYELTQVGTDAYLERAARRKLGLVMPNEKIFIDASKIK